MRDEQAAVERNLGPAARREQGIVQRAAVFKSKRDSIFELEAVKGLRWEGADLLVGERDVALERKLAAT